MLLTNVILLLLSCAPNPGLNPYPTIGAIPPPPGYHRIAASTPFASWLRGIPLKKDRTVYLYNGFRLSGDRLIPYTRPGSNKPCEDRACFDEYLLTVFSYCGTLSLERQLAPVSDFGDIRPGDVLIRGGSPGHAMLVIDMAEDAAGNKVYLLAQVICLPRISMWWSIRWKESYGHFTPPSFEGGRKKIKFME